MNKVDEYCDEAIAEIMEIAYHVGYHDCNNGHAEIDLITEKYEDLDPEINFWMGFYIRLYEYIGDNYVGLGLIDSISNLCEDREEYCKILDKYCALHYTKNKDEVI